MHMKKSDANDEESGYPMVDTMDSIGSSLGVETDQVKAPSFKGTQDFFAGNPEPNLNRSTTTRSWLILNRSTTTRNRVIPN